MTKAKSRDPKPPGLPLAVSLAVCAGLVILALFALTLLLPDRVRCVAQDNGTIKSYGITWLGVLTKAEAVDLVQNKGVHLSTRCGLHYAAHVEALPKNDPERKPYYLQTARDDEKCGNLETLPDCSDLTFPLIGGVHF